MTLTTTPVSKTSTKNNDDNRRKPKARLYSTFKNHKLAHSNPSSSGKNTKERSSSDRGGIEKKKRKKSTTVKLQQKMKFYQKSERLPTSINTFQKSLIQIHDILKDSDKPTFDNNSNNLGKNHVHSGFSISENALKALHWIHAHDLGIPLTIASKIADSQQSHKVTAAHFELACDIYDSLNGRRWNMVLEPKNNDENKR